MPRTGTPASYTPVSQCGAPVSETLFGPPDSTIPTGRRRRLDEIPVARPHAKVRRNRVKQRRARVNVDGREPELAMRRRRDFAAKRVRHQLHPVTDAEHGNAGLVDPRFAVRRSTLRDALRPTRQHDACRRAPHDLAERRIERKNLGIDRQLAKTSRDQLGELRSEVEDDDSLMIHGAWTVPIGR